MAVRQLRRGRWQQRSRHEQVETATRWTLMAAPWFFSVSGGGRLFSDAPPGPMPPIHLIVAVASLAGCGLASLMTGPAVEAYVGAEPPPRLRAAVRILGAVLAAQTGLLAVVVGGGALRDTPTTGLALFSAEAPFFLVAGLVLSLRAVLLAGAGLTVVSTAAFVGAGMPWPVASVSGTLVLLGALCMIATGRGSGWYIAVLNELDSARESQSQLAVVNERLRFSRDLHDVMGRNLAAIALKSELAVQLLERGADTAAAQMTEVQQLAQESQREVRDVVRGYRETALQKELDGARGVLQAAGIDCRMEISGSEHLPGSLQTALGWAVREGTTNVLRHADARHCTLRLRAAERAVLVMENDGAVTPGAKADSGAGTGLRGLTERLAPLGGTLASGAQPEGRFRMVVELPLGVGGTHE